MLRQTTSAARKFVGSFTTAFVFLFCLSSLSASAQCDCERVREAEFANCAVPITTLNGQNYRTDGVEGGLSFIPSDSVTFIDGIANPVPTEWIGSGLDTVNENTAILVIDSFGAGTGAFGTYLVPSNIGTTDADVEAARANPTNPLTHGALVFNHTNALLLGALGDGAIRDVTPNWVEWETSRGARLFVVMVHALDYGEATETSIVAPIIAQAISAFQQQPYGVTRFVLNMSFAILPCETINGYAQAFSEDPDADLLFDEYVKNLDGVDEAYYYQFITPAQSLVNPDPVLRLIGLCGVPENVGERRGSDGAAGSADKGESIDRFAAQDGGGDSDPEGPFRPPVQLPSLSYRLPCDPDQPNLYFVGAAGNSQEPYPFYPAAYPGVTSVSAHSADRNDTAISLYSNSGADIRLAGGWFPLIAFTDAVPDSMNTVPNSQTPLYYRGTSFAAPLESVCQALLIGNQDVCEDGVTPS